MKVTKPVHSYKGLLTLGNPMDYDTAMTIDVERYPRVMVQRPPSASQFVIKSDMAPTQSISTEDRAAQDLAAVTNSRTYQVIDKEAPGGKRDVEQEELAKGYNYGSTAVPIAESDRNVTTFETMPCLDIIGFIQQNQVSNGLSLMDYRGANWSQYERYMDMTNSHVIIAMRTNDKANMALSSFIHALHELEDYAVARLVPKANNKPAIVLLAPSIEPDHECLYEFELPFAEDIRSYRFPALDKVMTVSGKELKQHRNLPSDALVDAMSKYVDEMDLSKFGTDDEGQPAEYMPIDDTFSPVLHRVNQVIRQRAVYPDKDLPPIPEILTKYSKPPEELAEKVKPVIQNILEIADIKKVPPKARSRRTRREAPKPLSGLDVNALLSSKDQQQRKKISPENAVPEFKQLLDTATTFEDADKICREACDQLGTIIENFIRHSVGDSGYGRAVEAIGCMREECLDIEHPSIFNVFLKKLKSKIMAEELGGDRREMWFAIRKNRLGLIKRTEQSGSGVTEEEAKEFMSFR